MESCEIRTGDGLESCTFIVQAPACFHRGGCPDLHFHTLHGTQIYKKPNLLETQIYTSPNLLETQIYTKPNLPMTLIYTKIYTKPDLHRSKFTQNPYLHRPQIYKNPNLHIDKNSKEGQTYAIFLKSPWYEDLKSNSPGCLTCKYTNTASVKVPHRPNKCYIFWKALGKRTSKTMISGV